MSRKRRQPSDPEVTAAFAAQVRDRIGSLPLQSPPPGAGKLSEALEKLIEPCNGPGLDLAHVRLLALLGVVAWNADAAGPEDGPRLLLKARIELGRGRTWADAKVPNALLDVLCQRKKELFPDDKRFIVHHDVRETREGFRIQVAGLMPRPDADQP
jgi:hypothetical protein